MTNYTSIFLQARKGEKPAPRVRKEMERICEIFQVNVEKDEVSVTIPQKVTIRRKDHDPQVIDGGDLDIPCLCAHFTNAGWANAAFVTMLENMPIFGKVHECLPLKIFRIDPKGTLELHEIG